MTKRRGEQAREAAERMRKEHAKAQEAAEQQERKVIEKRRAEQDREAVLRMQKAEVEAQENTKRLRRVEALAAIGEEIHHEACVIDIDSFIKKGIAECLFRGRKIRSCAI
jgi:hypothetical protein